MYVVKTWRRTVVQKHTEWNRPTNDVWHFFKNTSNNEYKHITSNETTRIGIQIPTHTSSSPSTISHPLSYTVTIDESYEKPHRHHTPPSPITTTQTPSSPCLIQQRHQPQGTDTNLYKTVETYQQRSTKYTLFLFLSPKHWYPNWRMSYRWTNSIPHDTNETKQPQPQPQRTIVITTTIIKTKTTTIVLIITTTTTRDWIFQQTM